MEENAQLQRVDPELPIDSGNNIKLLPSNIYRNDPWMILLREKLSLNNWISLIIIVLLSIICFYGLYILPGTGQRLANQPLFALLETTTATLFFIAYLWMPDTIAQLFNTLWDEDVLDQSKDNQNVATSYTKFIKDLTFWMNRPFWPIGTLIFIIIYLVNRYLVNGPPFLIYVPLWLQLVTAVLDVIIAYNAILCIIRLLITLVFANRLFRSFTIHVKPLHPDGAGGLGVMRNIVWFSVIIIVATTWTFFNTIQLMTNRNTFSSTLDIIALIATYVILTPTFILGWLLMPHSLMLKERDKALKPLVDEFQAITEHPQTIEKAETASILADNDRLSAIKHRYSLINDSYPIWPLEVSQIRRLIATLSIPALLSLIPSIIDFITKRF